MQHIITLASGVLSAYASIDWFWSVAPQAKNLAILVGQLIISGVFASLGFIAGVIVMILIESAISYAINGPKKEACDGK